MLHFLKDEANTQVFRNLLTNKQGSRDAALPTCIAYPSSPSSPFILFIPVEKMLGASARSVPTPRHHPWSYSTGMNRMNGDEGDKSNEINILPPMNGYLCNDL
jgi:hypothetical protein